MLRGSLANRSDYLLLGTSLIAGIGLAGAICVPTRLNLPMRIDLGTHAIPFALPIALFPTLLMLVLISAVLTPLRYASEQSWLKTIPFPFAHQGYLLALKSTARVNTLSLLLTFDHDPVHKDFEELAGRRIPGSKLIWVDEATVLVTSPPRQFASGSFARGVYNNAGLHRWFRRVAVPFLTHLHQKAGLKKVTVRT